MKGTFINPGKILLRNLTAGGIGLLTLCCLFPPEHFLFIQLSHYAVHFMLFLLLGGIAFIIAGDRKLLITSLACAGILALYLKQSGNTSLKLAPLNEEPGMGVSVVNLNSIEFDLYGSFDLILKEHPDIVAFQEVTPDWQYILVKYFKDYYPYTAEMIRIDPFGQLIFSKYPIRELDTIFSNQIPALSGLIDMGDGMKTRLFSMYLPPAFDLATYKKIRSHLEQTARIVSATPYPLLCLGDFQTVPWSHEIQTFRYIAGLEDSRRSFNPIQQIQQARVLSKPLQHIFYSTDLECSTFKELHAGMGEQIGLFGYYQRIPAREYISSNFEK